MAQARLILHLPGSVLIGAEKWKPFYRHIAEGFAARSGVLEARIHDRATLAEELAADQDFHITDHGTSRHARLLNSAIAYVFPFWHLDPWGIRALSSIAAKPFAADEVPAPEAQAFLARLRSRLVKARTSRYPQPEERAAFPQGCIAVFLQSEAHRGVAETCHLDREAMLEAVLGRGDPRPVVVKIHPRDKTAATRSWLEGLAAQDARLIVTGANIHDILAAAAVTVTINSAVGIESLIHGVPLVLCGQSDFHHAAVTCRHPDAMPAALAEAEAGDRDFARYLFWYFKMNCLASGSPTLIDDMLAKIAATGFDIGRFGLR